MANNPKSSAPSATPADSTFINGSNDAMDTTMSMARFRKGPIGESGLIRYNGRIYDESRDELRFPESIRTFNKMSYDSTISAARNVFGMFIRKTDISAKPADGQEKNKKAKDNAEFVNWQLNNFDRSWRQIITDVMTYDLYGFSIQEMVFDVPKDGDYKGLVRVKDFAPRAQSSLDKWIWSKDGRKLIGFEQNLTALDGRSTLQGAYNSRGSVNIPINKCVLFSYNSTKDNPQGSSPLKGCYVTWTFKCLLEDYESTGVAKDMAGMPVFGIDKDTLVKGRNDPTSSEAVLLNYLETAGANMHAGEQNFLVNPIAYDDTGKPLFTFELSGVNGGNKNYDCDVIIKRRQNEILMAYFADVLKLGQDGVGSFALADSKNALLAHAVEDHLDFILEAFQTQYIKTLAKLNGWSEKDTPILVADDIEDRDLDELGKYIQRVVSVGAMSVDKDMDAELRKAARLPKADYKKPMPDNEGNTSRGGDGMAAGGVNGTSKKVADKDNSVSNNENASVGDSSPVYKLQAWDDKGVTISTPNGQTLNMTFNSFKEFLN